MLSLNLSLSVKPQSFEVSINHCITLPPNISFVLNYKAWPVHQIPTILANLIPSDPPTRAEDGFVPYLCRTHAPPALLSLPLPWFLPLLLALNYFSPFFGLLCFSGILLLGLLLQSSTFLLNFLLLCCVLLCLSAQCFFSVVLNGVHQILPLCLIQSSAFLPDLYNPVSPLEVVPSELRGIEFRTIWIW